MEAVKGANLALRLLLGIAAVVAVCYWGFTVGDGRLSRLLLGIGDPILVVIVWAIFVAPDSAVSTPGIVKLVAGLVILELAAVAFWVAAQEVIAIVFGVLVLANAALILVWGQ